MSRLRFSGLFRTCVRWSLLQSADLLRCVPRSGGVITHSWVPLLHLWAKRMEMRISLQQTHKAAVPKASGSAGPSAASVSRTTFSEKPAVYPSAAVYQHTRRVRNTHLTFRLRSAVSWARRLCRQENKEINKQDVQKRLEG